MGDGTDSGRGGRRDMPASQEPRHTTRLFLSVGLGLIAGLLAITTVLTHAPDYLFDDPATCANCHVMRSEFASWHASSHRAGLTCNDCHVPHDLARKYLFKAMDGMRHAALFTIGAVPEPITIRQESKDTVQENCLRCHSIQIADTRLRGGVYCFDCHRTMPHGAPLADSMGAPISQASHR
jgi:cytochrome c nitrite reductase small subunit